MKIEWDKSKPTGDPCRLLSIDRAKKLLNYRPNINLYDGLIKTIDWYKRNKKL
jgi:nucleoside-diphosphate-sugar epimerase